MSQPSDRGRLVKVFGADCGSDGGFLIVQVLSESAANSHEPAQASTFPVTNRNHWTAEDQIRLDLAEILRKEAEAWTGQAPSSSRPLISSNFWQTASNMNSLSCMSRLRTGRIQIPPVGTGMCSRA